MSSQTSRKLMFLAWRSPWPAYSGGDLRTLGLLKELNKSFDVELVVMLPQALSNEQEVVLKDYSASIVQIPLKNITVFEKLLTLLTIFRFRVTYHCAVLNRSFRIYPDILKRIQDYPGVVYASYGHWGSLIGNQQAPNWILDQHNADVDFWRIYASQVSNPLMKLAALINWQFADRHFRRIYRKVGHIVSVCEEDKQLTLALAPSANIDVIPNGVDCSYFFSDRVARMDLPRLLFTGTSVARNMTALHNFVRNVFPLIQQKIPNVELLVGGNFDSKAQAKFKANRGVRFTGRVDDMRPVFNQSDVFVAPFEETHGSKLKIAEAMAMGISIASTPEGIRGFPLVDGESVLVGYSKEQFASHAVTLLSDSKLRESMGKNARKIAEVTIDWAVLGKQLKEIVNLVFEDLPSFDEKRNTTL